MIRPLHMPVFVHKMQSAIGNMQLTYSGYISSSALHHQILYLRSEIYCTMYTLYEMYAYMTIARLFIQYKFEPEYQHGSPSILIFQFYFSFLIVSHNFLSFSVSSSLISVFVEVFPSCFLVCASKLCGSLNLKGSEILIIENMKIYQRDYLIPQFGQTHCIQQVSL